MLRKELAHKVFFFISNEEQTNLLSTHELLMNALYFSGSEIIVLCPPSTEAHVMD